VAAESRPLTAREREACLSDLAGYRRLLAASRREAAFSAACACSACRRKLEATKLIYVGMARDVQAEIETRIAGIRALEHDLTEQVQP
jgi:hypothetical protein